jgi:hypothetical protein
MSSDHPEIFPIQGTGPLQISRNSISGPSKAQSTQNVRAVNRALCLLVILPLSTQTQNDALTIAPRKPGLCPFAGRSGWELWRFFAPRVGLRHIFPSGLEIDLRLLGMIWEDSQVPPFIHIMKFAMGWVID